MSEKQRLDVVLHQRGLAASREKARAMIMAGEVLLGSQLVDKPGMRVDVDAELTVKARPRFVSRGGDKLAGALADFKFDVTGLVCADVGASTGGFTDCLLQYGAVRVYAIDVGYGQLDYALRQDSRVVVMERTNARYLEKLPEAVNLVVVDASFISLKLLLPMIKGWLNIKADVIALIKPQFEARKQEVGKGGVVKDSQIHRRVLEDVLGAAIAAGFQVCGLTTSALRGPAGNVEFLAWFGYGRDDCRSVDIAHLVESVLPDSLSSR
jgi:23S rRNA (cytidine1920-2'-O)/16S rRNA (cytidine1409-2'-O)-methyltransferase